MTIVGRVLLNWKLAFNTKVFWVRLLFLLFLSSLIGGGFHLLLRYAELRKGFIPYDPLFFSLTPQNYSTLIFALTYCAVVFALLYFARSPWRFFEVWLAYLSMNLLRAYAVYLVDFAPSADIIPLVDPILENTIYGGIRIKSDLFFSGHTATLFLPVFLSDAFLIRITFSIIALLVGFLLIHQHVHYTWDVLFAPIASFLAVYSVKGVKKKWNKPFVSA